MTDPTIDFQIQTHHTQFQIPVELIKKNFKSIQKLIEKQKKQLSEDIVKIKKNESMSKSIKLEMIKKLVKNFEIFKRKLEVLVKRDEEYRSRLIARLENMCELTLMCRATGKITEKKKSAGDAGKKRRNGNSRGASASGGGDENGAGVAVNDGGNGGGGATAVVVDDDDDDDDDKELDLKNSHLISWFRDQANLLIVDYLIKSNYSTDPNEENAGITLLNSLAKTNPKLLKLIDYDLLLDFNKIFLSIIAKHDLSLIVNWFGENKAQLKKNNSNLEFEINYCKFLTLIEKGDINEAIKFSRENLSSYGNKENYQPQSGEHDNHLMNLEKLKGLGGLLVFRSLENFDAKMNEALGMTGDGRGNIPFTNKMMLQHPYFREYQKLLSNERWKSLAQCFIENFIDLYGITKNYPLFIYLSAGLSSLKTKSCYYNYDNTVFTSEAAIETAVDPSSSSYSSNQYLTANDTEPVHDDRAPAAAPAPAPAPALPTSSSMRPTRFRVPTPSLLASEERIEASLTSSASTRPSVPFSLIAPRNNNNHNNASSNNNRNNNSTSAAQHAHQQTQLIFTNTKLRGPDQYYKLLGKVNNCPACSPEMFQLSRNLPYAQLITSVSSEPFKLPNGNIYPFDKLLTPNDKYLSTRNELLRQGKVKDPLTHEIFFIDNCRRVYPA
ncbi:uncharacterized protein LODBEIA_P34030 [Lodderomyces beijingensis]|uniref:Protein FYV10 n=1 Tax=Lodderomyces beijingensis TaxID=1775926 RepID=A0ABP0ZM12_9ASCO